MNAGEGAQGRTMARETQFSFSEKKKIDLWAKAL